MKIAIVGATGSVGKMILKIFEEKSIKTSQLFMISSKSNTLVNHSNKTYKTTTLDEFDFKNADVAFFAAGSDISKKHAEEATKKGCFVIDKSAHFRMYEDVPLIVPEINANDISNAKKLIVSNPNCSTTPLALSFYKINKINTIDHIVVSTYQAVSGLGKKGLKAYEEELLNDELNTNTFFKSISNNVVPQIDHFLEDGSTKEEWKMKVELNKILKSNIESHITCVRVPVKFGHSMSVFVNFKNNIKKEDIVNIWKTQNDLSYLDNGYATPKESIGQKTSNDKTHISRLRQMNNNSFMFWIVSDNLRKGAALNAVQIFEHFLNFKRKAA